MIQQTLNKVEIRNAVGGDGVKIWEHIKKHGGLDLNSAYCYMVICHHHGNSCYVAVNGNRLAGFVTAYYLPDLKDTLFVWQVGVDPDFRGQGVASQLLDSIIRNHPNIHEINTTIEPANKASQNLFKSFAKRHGFSIASKKFIRAEDFPGNATHADEDLFILRKTNQ